MKLVHLISAVASLSAALLVFAQNPTPQKSIPESKSNTDRSSYKSENRIGEIRKKVVPIVNIRADWNETKEGKKVYEAEKGWALYAYKVIERSKSRRANYSVDKRAAGSDFEQKETLEKIAQELTDYAREKGDDKSKERLETFFRDYTDFYQHVKSSQSRLEFSYDITGSGKFWDQYGGWLDADLEIEEARLITPDETDALRTEIRRRIDAKKSLDDILVNFETEPKGDR